MDIGYQLTPISLVGYTPIICPTDLGSGTRNDNWKWRRWGGEHSSWSVLNSQAQRWKLQASRNCFCAWMRYHEMGMLWMHWLRMDSPSQICSALTSMSFVHLHSHFSLVTQTALLLRSINPLCTRLTWPCISEACSRLSLGVVFMDRSSFESHRGC